MMEKFPNFAHTYIATIGTMISYSQVRLSGFTPYQAIPVAILGCGLLGLAAIALFGINAAVYESLYPVLMVVVVLIIKPEGMMGAFEKPSEGGKPLMTRLKDGLARIVGMIRGSSS